MREGAKAGLTVIVADAAIADSAKGKIAIRYMHYRVIDAAAAERNLRKHLVLDTLVLREQIESQRLRPSLYQSDDIVEFVICNHWQQGSEDFLLHHGVVPGSSHDGWCYGACLKIMLPAQQHLRGVNKLQDALGVAAIDNL